MSADPAFEAMLTGGHPNSLGRTIEVVEQVLAAPQKVEALYSCYQSSDEVVRLRVSNALKRVAAGNHELLIPFINRLIDEIGDLDQASAQWSLADLFATYWDDMNDSQKQSAQAIVKRNLAQHNDWIVLNRSMDALMRWSQSDVELAQWLLPHLERLSADPRKSVASRAKKNHTKLSAVS